MPDELSAPFWEAADRLELAVQRCTACGTFFQPPVMLCQLCLSPSRDFRFEATSGRGKVKTWTVMRQAFLPGFRDDVPYVVAEIELDGTASSAPPARMIARLVDTSDEGGVVPQPSIGAPVEAVFQDMGNGHYIPHFRLTPPPGPSEGSA